MKKTVLMLFFALCLSASSRAAEGDGLSAVMPLLQAKTRTAAQNQQVLNLFVTSKNPDTVFAAGASLARIPPAASQEAKLLNVIIKDSDVLKKVFASVILTAMGRTHEELSPLLRNAAASQDRAVRAYAAGAYSILNPQTTPYNDEIVNLYIYDPALAQRAMNLLCANEKQTIKRLRRAAASDEAQVRAAAAAWLGDLQNKDAAKQLLKMAKTELNAEASAAVASSLAKNRQWTLEDTAKGLSTRYGAQAASTYALALGFMTGNALEHIKQGLASPDVNVRVNSARAAAYMAGVLASSDAALYTADKDFDAALLKSLIPALSAMVKKDNASVKVYADNALKQIAKLK